MMWSIVAMGVWIGCFNAQPNCHELTLTPKQWSQRAICDEYISKGGPYPPACKWYFDNTYK